MSRRTYSILAIARRHPHLLPAAKTAQEPRASEALAGEREWRDQVHTFKAQAWQRYRSW